MSSTNKQALPLTSCIPCAQQVHATREEASLQNTKHRSQRRQLLKVLDKAHANHDAAPQESYKGQMQPRADFADEDGRGRLEDDVGGKEDEVGNVLRGLYTISHVTFSLRI